MKRKIIRSLAAILALSLCLSITALAADQPDLWAQNEVRQAIASGLVPQDMQNNYQDDISRLDFCVLMVTMLRKYNPTIVTQAARNASNPFTDTNDQNVAIAYKLGIVSGVSDTEFNPSGDISRQEAATMLKRAAVAVGINLPGAAATSFSDYASIADWARPAVNFVNSYNIMKGIGSNLFSPNGPYTREEAYITSIREYNFLLLAQYFILSGGQLPIG